MKILKRWQEPIYALGGFGPGFMYQIVMTYLLYFYRPALSRVESGALILAPAGAYAFGLLVARILDGVVDIPIATWTDNLKSRWGRRRPLMILGFIPTVLSFLLLWYPPMTGSRLGPEGHWGNAIFVIVVSSLYFFFHTLIIVPCRPDVIRSIWHPRDDLAPGACFPILPGSNPGDQRIVHTGRKI